MKKILLLFLFFAFSTMASFAVTANEQKSYDEFMLKLKACTPATASLFDGKHQVYGYNQACGYRVDYKSGETYICKFPTPVAEMFGYQSTVALRKGEKSSFVNAMLNNSNYCQKQ